MPILFLHIRDGANFIRDPEGAWFTNIASARIAAIESARELMSQSILAHARVGIGRHFEITDSIGRVLLVVPFREALANSLTLRTQSSA
jgi:hypothetical protein